MGYLSVALTLSVEPPVSRAMAQRTPVHHRLSPLVLASNCCRLSIPRRWQLAREVLPRGSSGGYNGIEPEHLANYCASRRLPTDLHDKCHNCLFFAHQVATYNLP